MNKKIMNEEIKEFIDILAIIFLGVFMFIISLIFCIAPLVLAEVYNCELFLFLYFITFPLLVVMWAIA